MHTHQPAEVDLTRRQTGHLPIEHRGRFEIAYMMLPMRESPQLITSFAFVWPVVFEPSERALDKGRAHAVRRDPVVEAALVLDVAAQRRSSPSTVVVQEVRDRR